MKPERPKEIPGVCKSSRVKFETKQYYLPSMKGSKYTISVAQLEDHGSLHLDAHTFFMKIQEEQPDIITEIMTQLSINTGLKEWGTKSRNAVHSNIKPLHFRNTFKPRHWKETDNTQSKSVLESYMLLKQKRYGKIKGKHWLV